MAEYGDSVVRTLLFVLCTLFFVLLNF